MQISKKTGLFALTFLLISPLIAESLEMPEMPQVSMPSLDSNFYTPTIPKVKAPQPPVKEDTATDKSVTQALLTDATTPDDLISSFLTDSSTLTAKDISSLYDSGMFTDLSSLNSSTILLNQVLKSLDDLKTEQKKATPAQQETLNNTMEDSQTFKKREPSILRFKINGYSITDSLSTVFFSEPEPDGTFLLTADRKYFVNQKPRTETFYILFKAVKNSGASVSYEVQPSIVQDYENTGSFIYRLANLKKLTAEKTGNLVVMRTSGDLNVDMLLDIDK